MLYTPPWFAGTIMIDAHIKLSVVIPALNEAARLPATLASIDRFLASSSDLLPAEIIVVDDGSTDGTDAFVRGLSPSSGIRLHLCRHDFNRGKGAAVRSGFGLSSGKQVLLCDADLATPIEEVRTLLGASSGSCVVVGSRALDRELISTPQPLYRDLMGRTFNLLVRLLVLRGVWDTQCGFKLFPGWVAHALATAQRIDGFAYDVEYLALARVWGVTIQEVGVRWGHVEESRVLPGRHSLQMFRDLFRISLRRWAGLFPAGPERG